MLISLDFTTLAADTIERLIGSDGSPYEKRVDARGRVTSNKCIADEVPFEELPEGWCWARLGAICRKLTDGSHNPPTKQSSGYPVISATNITNRTIDLSVIIRYCDENGFQKENPRTQIKRGDIILGIIGGSIGNVGVYQSNREVIAQRSVAIIDSTGCNDYLSWALESPLFYEYYKSAAGTAQGGIYLQALSSMLLPLPPLVEQRRIVERVGELMPLVEEYGGLEDAREALDAALPSRLRKSVLQMAVQGGLAPQDPTDEPAGVLLERIRGQRRQLVVEGKMKAPKGGESIIFAGSDGRRYEKRVDAKGRESEPVCIEDEIPFEVPNNWEWARLESVADIINGFTPKRSEAQFWDNGKVPWFTASDIRTQGRIISKTEQTITSLAMGKRRTCPPDTVLICCTASVGEAVLTKIPLVTNQQFNSLVQFEEDECRLVPQYLLLWSLTVKHQLVKTAGTTTIPFVSVAKLGKLLIPVPSTAEQHRIVERVSKLMPLITSQ